MRRSVALVLFHIFDGLGDAIVDKLPVTCQNTADRVNSTPCDVRCTSFASSSRSILRICWLMAGCDHPVSRATAENEPKRSTFHKVTRICGFSVFVLNPVAFVVMLMSVFVLAFSRVLLSAGVFI